jgi:osmotically inducible protein OsmC
MSKSSQPPVALDTDASPDMEFPTATPVVEGVGGSLDLAYLSRRPQGATMPTRTAHTAWTGGLQDGSGTVELTSSKVASFDVSFPKRAAEDADGTTSPEELIAAAHSACFSMTLSRLVAAAGGTPRSFDVTADVNLGPDPAGGFRISGIKLTVRGYVDGLDDAGFKEAAEKAKTGCPVSKALTGTDITLDAALA